MTARALLTPARALALALMSLLSGGCYLLGTSQPLEAPAKPAPADATAPPADPAPPPPSPPDKAAAPAGAPPNPGAQLPAAQQAALSSASAQQLTNPAGTGATGFGLLGWPVGAAPLRASYRVTVYPDVPVKSQPTNLGMLQQDLAIAVPVWQDSCNEWTFQTNVRNESFHTGAVLPDTGQPFPDELWNVRFGTMYRHQFDNGWTSGATVNVGSASDKPFHSINEMSVGANAFLRIPSGDTNAWLFSLAYSTNSQLPIPIPGVAYLWQPSPNFRASIGVPFQIMYRPINDLTLNFTYMPLTNIQARATYRVWKPLRIYAGYAWTNESYFLADRTDVNNRFFSYAQKVSTGVQYIFSKHALMDLSAGYLFDRYYYEGRSFSVTDSNRINLGDGAFISLQFTGRW